MKRDGFQRTVRAHRIEREIGDAPSLGHVERFFGKEFPKGMLRRKKRNAGKRATRRGKRQRLVIATWSLVYALVVLLLVVAMVWLSVEPNPQDDAAGNANSGKDAAKAPRFPAPSKDAALSLVRHAMLIRDPVKVTDYFRIDSATPAEIVGFLENMAARDGLVTDCLWQSSLDTNGMLIDAVLVKYKLGEIQHERMAFLTPDDKGRWRIDFDAFARTVTPSWGEILNGSARQGTVRILFVTDTYFNGPFGDESQWECYRLGSPDLTEDLWGYCRKDSPQAAAMKSIMIKGITPSKAKNLFRATLGIRRVDGAQPRQFEINRVLAEDWVRSAEPFDNIR